MFIFKTHCIQVIFNCQCYLGTSFSLPPNEEECVLMKIKVNVMNNYYLLTSLYTNLNIMMDRGEYNQQELGFLNRGQNLSTVLNIDVDFK